MTQKSRLKTIVKQQKQGATSQTGTGERLQEGIVKDKNHRFEFTSVIKKKKTRQNKKQLLTLRRRKSYKRKGKFSIIGF